MKFILGKKIAMTQVFKQDGTIVPVTRIQAGPCIITQIKKAGKNQIPQVQIGFAEKKVKLLSKPEAGHLKGIKIGTNDNLTVRYIKDFKSDQGDLKRGDTFNATIFAVGEKVQVIGTSKGKGFQGVVKRHHFAGGRASHGNKDQLRMPGSIGAGGVQRVFKGKRMAGHMGTDQVTIKNLEIVEIYPENNELLIKGAVPGGRNALLLISTNEGKIEVMQTATPVAVEAQAPEVVEAKEEVKVEVVPAEENKSEEATV